MRRMSTTRSGRCHRNGRITASTPTSARTARNIATSASVNGGGPCRLDRSTPAAATGAIAASTARRAEPWQPTSRKNAHAIPSTRIHWVSGELSELPRPPGGSGQLAGTTLKTCSSDTLYAPSPPAADRRR